MNRNFEKKLVESELTEGSGSRIVFVVGCDEAGRGPLCGPVVAGAVVMPLSIKHTTAAQLKLPPSLVGLDDSKKLKEADRNRLAEELKAQSATDSSKSKIKDDKGDWDCSNKCASWATASCDAAQIDELNILEASLHCMSMAADHALGQMITMAQKNKNLTMPTAKNTLILVDGPHVPRSLRSAETGTNKNNKKKAKKSAKQIGEEAARARLLTTFASISTPLPTAKAIVSGDSMSTCVAAASVLAKTERDAVMKEIAQQVDPAYGIAKNMGYPTAAHRAALLKLGATEFHRTTFAPVAESIKQKAAATKKVAAVVVEKPAKKTTAGKKQSAPKPKKAKKETSAKR